MMNDQLGRRYLIFCLAFFVSLSTSVVPGDDPADAQPPADSQPDARLQHLLMLAGRQEIRTAPKSGEPKIAKLAEKPLLRYTNPLYPAQSDGALLLWAIDNVPVVLSSMSIRNESAVFREVVSFSEQPLDCVNTSVKRTFWQPSASGFARRDLPEAPVPPANQRLRLIHMKRLFERFEVKGQRRMPAPLYRYQSPENGIVDGAIFTTVTANDPETLVLIEAHKSSDRTLNWRYSLGRMNSQALTVQLDDEVVWSVGKYWQNPRAITDPYMEQRHSDLPEQLSRNE